MTDTQTQEALERIEAKVTTILDKMTKVEAFVTAMGNGGGAKMLAGLLKGVRPS